MTKTVKKQVEIPASIASAGEKIIDRIAALLTRAERQDIEALAASLAPPEITQAERDKARVISGDDYSDSSDLNLELINLKKYYQRRAELLKDAITAPVVSQLLGLASRQTPHDRVKNNSLLAIKDGGVYKFPLCQFDPEGIDGIVNGLPEVLAALKVTPFTKLNWLNKPDAAMEGKTPLELLKLGEVDRVLVEARAVGFC